MVGRGWIFKYLPTCLVRCRTRLLSAGRSMDIRLLQLPMPREGNIVRLRAPRAWLGLLCIHVGKGFLLRFTVFMPSQLVSAADKHSRHHIGAWRSIQQGISKIFIVIKDGRELIRLERWTLGSFGGDLANMVFTPSTQWWLERHRWAYSSLFAAIRLNQLRSDVSVASICCDCSTNDLADPQYTQIQFTLILVVGQS